MQTIVKSLGLVDYETVWRRMQSFTENRDQQTADEVWIVEHPAVYTLGLNGKSEHLLNPGKVTVLKTDRGGQVTYHGPGQLVVYLLLDINRLQIGVRKIVTIIEQAIIDSLSQYGLKAKAKSSAPGVYIDEKKIASVGLRVKKGCCYHGLSVNNNMDLNPFNNINTCGYPDLDVTQLANFNVQVETFELAVPVVHKILELINQ